MSQLDDWRDQDAVLDAIVQRLELVGDWVALSDLRAAGWSDRADPPPTADQMLSKKLKKLKDAGCVTLRSSGRQKQARLSSRTAAPPAIPAHAVPATEIDVRVDEWRTRSEPGDVPLAAERTRYYTFAAARAFVRTPAWNLLAAEDAVALASFVKSHTANAFERAHGRPEVVWPASPFGRMISYLDAVLIGTDGVASSQPDPKWLDHWSALVDPTTARIDLDPPDWFPLWAGLGLSVAVSQGGDRMSYGLRYRLLDRVLEAGARHLESEPDPTLKLVTLHWLGLASRSSGYFQDAAAHWQAILAVPLPDGPSEAIEDARVIQQLAPVNIEYVHHDRVLRANAVNREWVRFGLGAAPVDGPLSLSQSYMWLASEHDPALRIPSAAIEPVVLSNLNVPGATPALQTLGRWNTAAWRWMKDPASQPSKSTEGTLRTAVPLSLHNQLSFPAMLATARSAPEEVPND